MASTIKTYNQQVLKELENDLDSAMWNLFAFHFYHSSRRALIKLLARYADNKSTPWRTVHQQVKTYLLSSDIGEPIHGTSNQGGTKDPAVPRGPRGSGVCWGAIFAWREFYILTGEEPDTLEWNSLPFVLPPIEIPKISKSCEASEKTKNKDPLDRNKYWAPCVSKEGI